MDIHGKECYTCGNSGHYSTNCPRNSSGYNNKKRKTSSNSTIITSTPEFPPTECRCGAGLCKIKLTPKTLKHFYSCPNSNEMHCGLETVRIEGPNFGRKYFACRIKKTHGACNFWQWQDDYYQPTSALDNIAYDDIIANEIDMIRREIENGEMDPDYPLAELEIHASDKTFSSNNKTLSPSPSPTSPLDVEPRTSTDHHAVVVRWFPGN
ncbi:Endonuclease 8-like 3 [Bienertia sinuspersici]